MSPCARHSNLMKNFSNKINMIEKKNLKWFLNLMEMFDVDNASTSTSLSNYSFALDDTVGLNFQVDGKKHVKKIESSDLSFITITPSIDYLFVSFPVSQPLNFLKEAPDGVEPILLSFSYKDRNTFLSTKMVREYFSDCVQFFLCSVNGMKSKGSYY